MGVVLSCVTPAQKARDVFASMGVLRSSPTICVPSETRVPLLSYTTTWYVPTRWVTYVRLYLAVWGSRIAVPVKFLTGQLFQIEASGGGHTATVIGTAVWVLLTGG